MTRLLAFLVLCALLVPVTSSADFGLGLSFGGYTGDRLYSATSNTPRIWENPTGDVSGTGEELLVDQESWAQLGLTGFGNFANNWGIRFDLAFTDVDVDGKVRDSTGASETVEWEQTFIFDMLVQATWRFGRSEENYPWLGLGPSLTVSSGNGNTLDQTSPGIGWGAGWRMSALEGAWFELGVRGILQWADWDDEEARLAEEGPLDTFEGESPIHSIAAWVSVGRIF